MFKRPMKMSREKWQEESRQVDLLVKEVEGEDSRSYKPASTSRKTR
jgi:lathosterol oxidase